MFSFYHRVRFKAARTSLRLPRTWWQHRGLKPSDVFLACYERSGSLWLRFVLIEILTGQPAGFENVNCIIPELHLHRNAPPILPGGRRLIKTHEQYRSEYHRAIYMVRDFRDAMLSNFARHTEWGFVSFCGGNFDAYLRAFLKGRVAQAGSWQDHVHSWLGSPLAARGDLLLIRFEDARRNPQATLQKILDFLGVTASPEVVRQAINNNSLEKMRAKEDHSKRQGYAEGVLRMHRGFEENGRCVRGGAMGGWRDKLSEAQIRLIDEYAGPALARLGYPLGSDQRVSGSEGH